MTALAQNEMKANGGMPWSVRLTEGLERILLLRIIGFLASAVS